MMRTLLIMAKAAAGIAVFLVLLGFAVKNTEGVVVHYFLGLEWQAPLVFVLLVFFSAGVVLGLTARHAILVRQRREILGLKRELRGLTRSPVAPMLAESA